MAYKITGKVISVGSTEELTARSGNSYQKRDMVMTVRKFDPYTGTPEDDEGNEPKFTLFGERCRDLNGIFKGDIVTVHFELSGRRYMKDGAEDHFTEIRTLRVEKLESPRAYAGMPQTTLDAAPRYGQGVSAADLMEERPQEKAPAQEDDLPF